MNFGEKLKALRISRRMSQKELAEKIGTAKSIISFYESGDRFPSLDVLVKIAYIFNTSTDYLLGVKRDRTIDVSGLTESEISVIISVIEVLKSKN